ncbi:hypothetical protein [Methanopyrus sp.]
MRAKVVAVLVFSSAFIGALTGVITYQWSISSKGARVGCYHVAITNVKGSVKPEDVKRALLRCPYVVRVGGIRTAPSSCDAYIIVKTPTPVSKYDLAQELTRALRKARLGKAPAVFLSSVNAYVVEVAVENPKIPASVAARKVASAPAILAVFKAERRGSTYVFEVASLEEEYPVAYSVTGALKLAGLKPVGVADVTPVKWGYVL